MIVEEYDLTSSGKMHVINVMNTNEGMLKDSCGEVVPLQELDVYKKFGHLGSGFCSCEGHCEHCEAVRNKSECFCLFCTRKRELKQVTRLEY